MKPKVLNFHWWQNKLKYLPLVQKFFLWQRLSAQAPGLLNIEPTNHCNLDCFFCPTQKTNRSKGFISLGLYRRTIGQLTHQPKLAVLWLNKDGEPLLHPKIGQLVAIAKRREIAKRVEIYTNGLLLNTTMARRLINARLDSLVVSLDATSRIEFKKWKKKDVYHRVVKNISDFLRLRQQMRVAKPLLTVKMIDWGKPRQVQWFEKLWQKAADNVIIQPLHQWEGSANIKYQISKSKNDRYPCNLPWLAPAINWNGTVVPCCVNYRKNELILGNVSKQSLTEIFQGKKFQALRAAHLKQTFANFPTCAHCNYWQQFPNMSGQLRRLGV